jgi:hypothetical protein
MSILRKVRKNESHCFLAAKMKYCYLLAKMSEIRVRYRILSKDRIF